MGFMQDLHDMDLLLLESLIAVAESGTITAAAEQVHISQSALSRRLQLLERELGADLLVRGRHGVELTALGQQTVVHARTIVGRYEQLQRDVAEYQGLEQGTVRIGGGATVTSVLLPQAISTFQARYPGIRFHVKEAGSHEIGVDVAAGVIELGIVTLPIATGDLEVKELLVDDIVLVGARSHPLAAKRVGPADLRRQHFIVFEAGSAIRQIIDARLLRAGVDADVAMELRSIPSILRMVATTQNLAFVSRLSLADQPDVTVIPVRGLAISRTLGLATRRGFALSPPARAFLNCLTGISRDGSESPADGP